MAEFTKIKTLNLRVFYDFTLALCLVVYPKYAYMNSLTSLALKPEVLVLN
jgi:hypothetical protein